MNDEIRVSGVILDPIKKIKISGIIKINNGKITGIEEDEDIKQPFILPGFVDSHIHIESSMLTPEEFSKTAKKHGTIAVVADPHEIANVAGIKGVDFMIENSKKGEIKFYFGAPSCVPASPFDTCYEILDSSKIESLLEREDIYFLGEMMNFPGVVNSSPDVIKKIEASKKFNKPIDGHAPGLSEEMLNKYVNSGISTDHECFTLDEAVEKIQLGMKILIREGSAAKNFNSLHPLIKMYPKMTMLCTDDCHPDDLMQGHINKQVKRSLDIGYNIFDILQVASVNPIKHYNLDLGLLQIGDYADFIVVDNLENFNVTENYIRGVDILKENKNTTSINNDEKELEYLFTKEINENEIKIFPKSNKLKAIQIIEGELVTEIIDYNALIENENIISDIHNDFLKIVVVNRYDKNEINVAFIKGFGIKTGAIAESIAHDSHHIIAVGADDKSLYEAINYVIRNKGGLCYYNGKEMYGLPLPVYGLMGKEETKLIGEKYQKINNKVIEAGCKIKAPFMTLSFMALTVIPKLKITPKGLFDVIKFDYVDQFYK